jgi:ABC-2 type transport system permease protein
MSKAVTDADLVPLWARRDGEVQTSPVTFVRAVRSEWIKFRSLRSTWAVLGVAIAGMFVIALLVAYNTRHLTPNLQRDDLAPSATMQGYYLGQLLIGALGVLFVSGEYSTGMIRSTLAAIPKRTPVLWAKLAVFVSITATSMVSVSLLAFLAAQGLLSHYRPGYSLGDPGVVRVVIGTGIYLTLVGLIAAALAWIIRSTPGSIVAYIAVVLVIPVLLGNVLGSWGKHIAEFTPTQAGASFSTSIHEGPSLSPWVGLLVMAAWVVVAFVAALITLMHRDA